MAIRTIQIPPRLFALVVIVFSVLPLAELALLIGLAQSVGLFPTLVVCGLTGFIGAWLARWQGLRTVMAAQEAMSAGRFPTDQIFDGACLLVGGVVLLTPGLITDFIGFALLLPPTRAILKRLLRRAWESKQGIVDAEVVD